MPIRSSHGNYDASSSYCFAVVITRFRQLLLTCGTRVLQLLVVVAELRQSNQSVSALLTVFFSYIHPPNSSMAGRIASLSEKSTTGFTATFPAFPPLAPYPYVDTIRSVEIVWPQWRMSNLTGFSLSGLSRSSYSSDSYQSNNSGYSSGSVSVGEVDFGGSKLTKIAQKMISDGYTQRMVQAFGSSGSQDSYLESWFDQLDISWVLGISKGYGLRGQFQLQLEATSASWLQELVDKWVRALTIIVVSIKEMFSTDQTLAVARFGKASISTMLVFVDAVLHDCSLSEAEKLPAILQLYTLVSGASFDVFTLCVSSRKVESIINEIGGSLDLKGNLLIGAISTTVMEVSLTLNEDSWAIEILRGGGDVHKNTRLIADCIMLMRKALVLTHNSAQSQNTKKLGELIDDTIDYQKDLLLQKSESCSDPSLRYLFLLNNSYFVEQEVFKHRHHWRLVLIPECQKYMDSYLEVSWGHVLSCITESNYLGPLRRWINTSSLAKFQSAFHKTYQAQKFWKVPDPQLRGLLRETIIKRVISGYRDYLKEHPELEKLVSGGSSSPDDLEKMLGELFEG